MALCCVRNGEDRMNEEEFTEFGEILYRNHQLEALLNEAYPFMGGHNWTNCDCPKCLWIHAYNWLVGEETTCRSPQLDTIPEGE